MGRRATSPLPQPRWSNSPHVGQDVDLDPDRIADRQAIVVMLNEDELNALNRYSAVPARGGLPSSRRDRNASTYAGGIAIVGWHGSENRQLTVVNREDSNLTRFGPPFGHAGNVAAGSASHAPHSALISWGL